MSGKICNFRVGENVLGFIREFREYGSERVVELLEKPLILLLVDFSEL